MKKDWLDIILKELHQEAYMWSRQCCSFNDSLAKDVLQVVYLKILEGKAIYREKSLIKTWLFSVIRYTAMDLLKAETKTSSLEDYQENPEEESQSRYAFYDGMIQLLPERQKEVLLLVFYHELTLEKAAEVMGISIGSVRTHYDRGKKNLKEIILKKTTHENSR